MPDLSPAEEAQQQIDSNTKQSKNKPTVRLEASTTTNNELAVPSNSAPCMLTDVDLDYDREITADSKAVRNTS